VGYVGYVSGPPTPHLIYNSHGERPAAFRGPFTGHSTKSPEGFVQGGAARTQASGSPATAAGPRRSAATSSGRGIRRDASAA
jgi:hypothetical protein